MYRRINLQDFSAQATPQDWLILALILLLFSIALFFYCRKSKFFIVIPAGDYYGHLKKAKNIKNWSDVTAKVIGFGSVTILGGKNFQALYAIIEFSDSENKIISANLLTSGSDYKKGDTVKIKYNPAAPSQVILA